MKKLIIIFNLFMFMHSKNHCRVENRVFNYFKLKSCHRSTLPIIFWTNVDEIKDCIKTAKEKNGLAFNFSPMEARKLTKEFVITCQVLGCPEILNSTTLIEDVGFDYYTAYGNLTTTQNATCIKNIGLFSTSPQKQNYNKSIDFCQKIGADLADISSEIRTKYLSTIINNTLDYWYKVAYVGLYNNQENNFITTFNLPLSCVTFRAWAPGHPLVYTKEYKCVVLDDNRMWRLVNCNRKLPALCEFFPEKAEIYDPCRTLTNNRKLKCIKREEAMNELMKNLSRIEQCAILNVEEVRKDKSNSQDES